MTTRYDIAALKTRLGGIRTEENPALVKQKSRDFFWYSPILKRQLDHVVADIVSADLLLVGSPTYKGSYPGLFKHLFDLIDPLELRGKPVILTATGGGDRHALVVEHQLRPLFGFFSARTLPTAIYASDVDFKDHSVGSGRLAARFDDLLDDLSGLLPAFDKDVQHDCGGEPTRLP